MMPFSKILRLGLIHVAVALTLVPINGTLNRIMIGDLGLAATLVAVLISLPYLFSPRAHPISRWGCCCASAGPRLRRQPRF
jgi:hypothetical protein